jgi:tetratricopeptide (TPR) repeat protein
LTRVARAFSRRCLRTAERPDAQAALPDVLKWIGVCDMGVGDWELAHERLKRSADLAARFGNRRSWEESMTGLGYLHVFRGEFQQSLDTFGALIRSARAREDRETLSWGLNGLAFNLVPMGRDREAFDAVQDAGAFAHDRVAPPNQAGSMAVLWLRQGQLALARQQADASAAFILGSRVSSFGMLPAYANVTDAYLGLCEAETGSRTELLGDSLRACRAFRAFARVFPIGSPGALIRQGRYDWLVGHRWRARHRWRQALRVARRLRMPYEEGVALYELGRHARGDARREALARAVEILDRLGAGHYVRRAREEMDR